MPMHRPGWSSWTGKERGKRRRAPACELLQRAMSLRAYVKKRDFSRTEEPRGDTPVQSAEKRSNSSFKSTMPRGCTTTSGWSWMEH